MKRVVWWIFALVVVPLLLLVAIALALQRWVHSEDFRGFVADQVGTAIGVPVELGSVDVDIWPLPAVALNQLHVKSQPPLTLERIVARPSWAPLLQRRLEVETVIVRNAVIPEAAVAAIAVAFKKKTAESEKARSGPDASGPSVKVSMPRRVVLDGISWVSEKGHATTVDATARFDDDGLPREAKAEVKQGNFAGAQATLERQPDHFALKAQIGGGTVTGKLRYEPGGKGASVLEGDFDTSGVEISALTAPSRTLTGRIEAHTTLKSSFTTPATLVDAMQTQTKFTIRGAVVHGVDLARAVKTVGANRGGETRLDTLAGNVATHGRAAQLNNLVATSGVLSANGNIAMAADKALSGHVTVDLASGAVAGALGIPLAVGGTLDAPTVTLSRGALIGAAIGTAIAPGLGTGGGAKIGDKLGEGLKGLFGK